MKKLSCLLLAVLMLLSFAACSNSAPTSGEAEDASIDVKALGTKITTELDLPGVKEMNVDSLDMLYSIKADDVEDCAVYAADGGSFPDEIIIIKAKNSDSLDKIEKLLNSRLDDVKLQSQNYDEENYAIAQKCKVVKSGNVIALFISAQHEQMETMFEEAAK